MSNDEKTGLRIVTDLIDNGTFDKKPTVKSCKGCRKVKTCYLYRMALQGIESFNEQANGIIKFPMKAEELAFHCPEFESPFDVLKVASELK